MEEARRLEQLPTALICSILTKLNRDVGSICSAASTSRMMNECAKTIFTHIQCFHLNDLAPTLELLRPLLQNNNPFLTTLSLDAARLDDSSLPLILRPSLQHLSLLHCSLFTGDLLSQLGRSCTQLRSLYLTSVAENRGRSIDVSHLEELLNGCIHLETLVLMFDVSLFMRHNFPRVWASASSKLLSLEIGYISSVMVTELLSPVVATQQTLIPIRPTILPNLQKLCLAVDYITDTMVGTISTSLTLLTHLDLRDSPIVEPSIAFDLTNAGLHQINSHGKLKHLSLVRCQEFIPAYFKRVNDLGILLMADRCSSMESICLGGFCRVTDTGFKTILHSCCSLFKLMVSHGNHLTDLVFHDIAATSLTLTQVSLRWCNLLTNFAVELLVSNRDISVLDLRDCRHLSDESLRAINTLPKLRSLLLDGCDITDVGLSHLTKGVMNSLVSLSVRGCRRLTDKCIAFLFVDHCNRELRELDLSNLPNISDEGILMLAKSRIPVTELRLRQCPLIGDTSIMVLASMQVEGTGWSGSTLKLLDLYNCGGITQLAFKWLKKPYFPRLRWLGVTGNMNKDNIDTLSRNRPFLHIASRSEELGTNQWDNLDDFYMHDYDEVDEFEQWLLEGEDGSGDEEMGEAADIAGMSDSD
ncbi:hypothetical protein Leryth_014072 [Lithospermum erythrorhizon]|nr:hypothetical protein Leryth_014072 [Lithospermum erythrorhizon]